MNKKFCIVFCCMVLFAVALLSCGKEEASGTADTVSSGNNWWDKFGKPEHGGTITFPSGGLMGVNFDVYNFVGSEYNFWFESLLEPDWSLDRNTWSMTGMFVPDQYWKGNLAESWEIADGRTVIIHLRKGIRWQNKPPVNGREFTAYDVEKHYDRILGTGSGYTKKAPMYAGMTMNWEKVTAKDKYTVVFKFKNASAQSLQAIADRLSLNVIEAPEWASLDEKARQDWHNAVGTGPWMLEKYLDNTSFTYVKNPDYWGYDPRHPENRLPYADKLVMLVIPDQSTMIAALRTKKVDIIGQGGGGAGTLDWQQAKTITSRNKELKQQNMPNGASGVSLRVDKAPFTDKRVRIALDMAIDRKAIAKSLYGGTTEGRPVGFLLASYKGYVFDYNDWPQSLKDEFEYNPEGAKKLLAEAGYPNGFKTNVVVENNQQSRLTLMQAYKKYFMDIGVDMDIKAMDPITIQSITRAAKHDQMSSQGAATSFPPTRAIDMFYSKGPDARLYGVNDAKYDNLRNKFWDETDPVKAAAVFRDIDRHYIEQHWIVAAPESYSYIIWQPYLKGYSGESLFWGQGITWSRLWVDKKMKDK